MMNNEHGIFEIIGGPDDPVIDEQHPDVADIHGGFEGGSVLKVGSVYHMFPTERAGEADRPASYDRIHTRIGYWTSDDAENWTRRSTIFESTGRYTVLRNPLDPRDRIQGSDRDLADRQGVYFAAMPVFDEIADRYRIYWVSYTAVEALYPSHIDGQIRHGISTVPGVSGIGGPYEDLGVAMEKDENCQDWEGRQGVDSFFPYRVGDRWLAFYGGAFPHGAEKWFVGLAEAKTLAGPWKRFSADVNPVTSMHPWFIENPIVGRLPGDVLIAIFDGGPDWLGLPNMFGYSLSIDGIRWSEATYFAIETKVKKWWTTMRTPLCLIDEGDDVFTIVFNAVADGRRFHPTALVRVRLGRQRFDREIAALTCGS